MADLKANLLIWQAITPVHSGTGQTSGSVIDLPIAREMATKFPILPASSIKGVLRDGLGLREGDKDSTDEAVKRANELYGTLEAAGKLTFTDARLLCLPVRSYKGTFAFITCPLIIQRLRRDLAALGVSDPLPELPADIAEGSAHLSGDALTHNGQVLFEDIDLTATPSDNAKALAKALEGWAGREDIALRLAVVPNDVFSYFSETATEVTAHTALEPTTKTVKGGALWYEEALPAESLLTSFLISAGESFNIEERSPLQIGGKGTVGKGLLSVKVVTHG